MPVDNYLTITICCDSMCLSSNKSIGAYMNSIEYKLIALVDGEEVYEVTRPSTLEIEQMFERAEYAVERELAITETERVVMKAETLRDSLREDGIIV